MLVNNISLGNHAHLSSWCLRYGLMKSSSLQLFEFLGNLFEHFENPLQGSSLICPSPTKAIWWDILKISYTYATCLCIELYQIFVTLVRILFTLSWSRCTYTSYLLDMLIWELALYLLYIPQNKAPHYVLISLSLSKLILQNRHGYRKIHTWRSKKKEIKKKRRKDSHVHKRVKIEREDHAKWSYNKSNGNN
jgi:hypothetical protein